MCAMYLLFDNFIESFNLTLLVIIPTLHILCVPQYTELERILALIRQQQYSYHKH